VTTLDFRRKVAAGRLGSLQLTLTGARYRTRVIRDAREGESPARGCGDVGVDGEGAVVRSIRACGPAQPP